MEVFMNYKISIIGGDARNVNLAKQLKMMEIL